MQIPSTMIVESHRSAATVYATADLTATNVLEAIASVQRLPKHVRALCVDLSGVRTPDVQALRALDAELRSWRAVRHGMTRVKLAADADPALVALRFPHQRGTLTAPDNAPPWGASFGYRIRDYRQGVVTRSLRERASSETR